MKAPIETTELPGLKLLHRGKVRDIYDLGDHLLIVVTDRVSAYDAVLSPPIPDKGRVLTSLSRFWFETLRDLVPHHLVTTDIPEMPDVVQEYGTVLQGRTSLVRRLRMFPVECVVRGYLTGSGWRDYRRTGAVCGHDLPADLPESVRLEEPLFTPATKAESGHDENIDFARVSEIVGKDTAERLRTFSLTLYAQARDIAAERGILIADTKLEFGLDEQGRIVLGDEAFTPDSSRFWEAASYREGETQQPLDKQMVRNWLDAQGWDHEPPAPTLPADLVARLSATYRDIHERLTGRGLGA
jgi:phosphoribosylaminoimidazole-succinocarboxamide synthase